MDEILILVVYGILRVTGHIAEKVVEYVVLTVFGYDILIVEVYDLLLMTLFVWVSLYVF